MSPAPAMHVADGRGLPVPLVAVEHDPVKRTSSTPAFLRLTPEECAAIDAGPARVPEPVKVKKAPKPAVDRNPMPDAEKQAEIIRDYLNGGGQRRTSRQHGIGERRLREILRINGHDVHPQGHAPMPLDVPAILAERAAGTSVNLIAMKHKTDKGRVSALLRAHGMQVGK